MDRTKTDEFPFPNSRGEMSVPVRSQATASEIRVAWHVLDLAMCD